MRPQILVIAIIVVLGFASNLNEERRIHKRGLSAVRGLDTSVSTYYASEENHHTYVPSRFAFNKKRSALECTPQSDITITWDPIVTVPPEVLDPVNLAVNTWSCILGSPQPIRVYMSWSPLGNGFTLAHTSTSSWKARTGPLSKAWYPKPLYNKLLGADIDPSSYDCTLILNSNWSEKFYFGTDGKTPSGKLDLATIVLHELAHCFAFTGFSWVNTTASPVLGYYLYNGYPAQYDRFTLDGFPNGKLVYRNYRDSTKEVCSVYQGNDMGWNGVVVRLYAPATYNDGSSIYHFDETLYPAGNPNSLMTPQLGYAEAVHDPGPLCEEVMVSLGWTTTPFQLDGEGSKESDFQPNNNIAALETKEEKVAMS